MSKLRFCPECGNYPKSMKCLVKRNGKEIYKYMTYCSKCATKMNSGYKDSKEAADAAWNDICDSKTSVI